MDQTDRDFFAQHGFINLGPILEREEVRYFHDLFEEDRRRYPYFWHRYGHHQEANYDALITTGQFDAVMISEFAKGDDMTRMLLRVGATGHVRTNTIRAYTEDEIGKIVDGM